MWRSRLAQAMTLDFSSLGPDGGGGHRTVAPAVVAAVCVRDRWDELSFDEQAWCVERICAEVYATPTPGTR